MEQVTKKLGLACGLTSLGYIDTPSNAKWEVIFDETISTQKQTLPNDEYNYVGQVTDISSRLNVGDTVKITYTSTSIIGGDSTTIYVDHVKFSETYGVKFIGDTYAIAKEYNSFYNSWHCCIAMNNGESVLYSPYSTVDNHVRIEKLVRF